MSISINGKSFVVGMLFALLVMGCMVAQIGGTDGVVSQLAVGAKYVFSGSGGEYYSGTIQSKGPGYWVLLENGAWINTEQTHNIVPL